MILPFARFLLIVFPNLSSDWINGKITHCVGWQQNSKPVNEHALPATIGFI